MCLDCTYHKLYFPCFDIQPIHASLPNCFLSVWDLSWCVMEQAQAEMGLVPLLLWRNTLSQAFTEVAGVMWAITETVVSPVVGYQVHVIPALSLVLGFSN